MKALDVLGTGARKVAAKAAAAVARQLAPPAPRARDPFYFDDERRAELNEQRGESWLPRRKGWLR